MSEKKGFTRREFLIGLSLAGAGVGLASLYSRVSPDLLVCANDRLRVGVIGLGSRGSTHVWQYLRLAGVDVCALCDTDETQLMAQAEAIVKAGRPRPAMFTDYRRIIDSQEVDAISIATPARFHATMAIAGCEGGKDVYVEKPCAASFSEGKRLVAAAEKYKRIVQQRMGTTFAASSDSAPLLASPSLGEVRSVNGRRWLSKSTANHRDKPNPQKHNSQALAELVDEAFDELDFARAMLEVGLPTHISTVSLENMRGRAPSRVAVRMLFDTPGARKRTLDFEVNEFDQVAGRGPQFESSNTFVTAGGTFTVTSDSRFSATGPAEGDLANFISCVRRRDHSSSNFPVAEARLSCGLVQLAQLSLRHKRGFSFDPASERVLDDSEINGCLSD